MDDIKYLYCLCKLFPSFEKNLLEWFCYIDIRYYNAVKDKIENLIENYYTLYDDKYDYETDFILLCVKKDIVPMLNNIDITVGKNPLYEKELIEIKKEILELIERIEENES